MKIYSVTDVSWYVGFVSCPLCSVWLTSLLTSPQVVQKLTQMIGKNVKLYDMVLQFLRTLFLRTRNVHYCTLRAELLMSLHDLDISEICSVDPCHKVGVTPPQARCRMA